MSTSIPAGAKCLTPKLTCAKFSKKKSWLWKEVKKNPRFPKPIYLAPMSPVFIEQQLDAYIAAQAELPRKPVSVAERSKRKAASRQSNTSGHAAREGE